MDDCWNAYAFTRTGRRVIIGLDLSREMAEIKARYEAAFIEGKMGDALTHCGDTWFGEGWLPRVWFAKADVDPFRKRNKRREWLPDIALL